MKYTANYRVTVGDINYGGHMGNDRALVVFQDARVQMLASLGFSEINIGDETGIIMVESGVRYLREVLLHDQLQIDVSVTELTGKKFCLEYITLRLPDQEKVFSGITVFLAFNYLQKKVVRLPLPFCEKMKHYLTSA